MAWTVRVGAIPSLVLVLTMLALSPRPVEARTTTPSLTADLLGQPISLADIGKYHCHDFDSPRIHCFLSDAARDAAVAPLLAATSSTYVIVWEDASYAGASLIMSQDYTALITVGWNDRISSFKAQNNLNGRFWTDWFDTGTFDAFCCNQNVSYVGSSFNDTFSSFQRL